MVVEQVNEWLDRWLADVATTHASPATARNYGVAANSFRSFTAGERAGSRIDGPLIVRYVRSLGRLAPRTQHSYAGALLRFLDYLVGEGIEPGIYSENGR